MPQRTDVPHIAVVVGTRPEKVKLTPRAHARRLRQAAAHLPAFG